MKLLLLHILLYVNAQTTSKLKDLNCIFHQTKEPCLWSRRWATGDHMHVSESYAIEKVKNLRKSRKENTQWSQTTKIILGTNTKNIAGRNTHTPRSIQSKVIWDKSREDARKRSNSRKKYRRHQFVVFKTTRHWSQLEEKEGYKLAQLVSPYFKLKRGKENKFKNCFSFNYRIPKVFDDVTGKEYMSFPNLPSLEVLVEPVNHAKKGKNFVHLWEKVAATPDGKWERTELDLRLLLATSEEAEKMKRRVDRQNISTYIQDGLRIVLSAKGGRVKNAVVVIDDLAMGPCQRKYKDVIDKQEVAYLTQSGLQARMEKTFRRKEKHGCKNSKTDRCRKRRKQRNKAKSNQFSRIKTIAQIQDFTQ